MTIIDHQHGRLMDRVYRHQRYIYDITRKWYLLGRDELIGDLWPPSGGRVLEIGCGTGRNLFVAAERYPYAQYYGIDISAAMLEVAAKRSRRTQNSRSIVFAQADAACFDPQAAFGVAGFDRVFISYALSMVPLWRQALRQAMAAVSPGGRLDIVDFGQQEELPALFRTALVHWLAWYHVKPRTSLRTECERLAKEQRGALQFRPLYGGYAWSLRLTKPAAPISDRPTLASETGVAVRGAAMPSVG